MNDNSLPSGVVSIAHNLYCTSPEAEMSLLEILKDDYDVETKDRYHYAKLKKTVYKACAKCNHCGHLNDRFGCLCHGFTCAGCKKVIYREYIHGAKISFSFWDDRRSSQMTFLIHSYENEILRVYAKPQKPRSLFGLNPQQVGDHLKKFPGCYLEMTIDGKKLLAFHLPVNRDGSKINLSHIDNPPLKKVRRNGKIEYEGEEKCQHIEVFVYKGKEFDGDLPVRQSFHVYPYRKAAVDKNLSRNILHAAGQSADCGYYYQDNREAFCNIQLEWMARYVDNFTDMKNFRKFLKKAPRSGPGFICALAKWVEVHTGVPQYVENKPNVINAVIGCHKVFNGENLHRNELNALCDALKDEEEKIKFMDIMG